MDTPTAVMLPLITPARPNVNPDRRGTNEASLVGLFSRIQTGEAERRSFRERRATPRVPVELECEELQGDSRYVRLTTDLSTFGLSTRQGPTPRPGSRMTLRLFLPDEPLAPLQLAAEVLGSYDGTAGMRLKFRQPSLEAVKRIHRFLSSQRGVTAV